MSPVIRVFALDDDRSWCSWDLVMCWPCLPRQLTVSENALYINIMGFFNVSGKFSHREGDPTS